MSDQLGLTIELDREFEFADAVDVVTAALKEEGLGELTRIDVDKTWKEKIDVDFRPYTILGACNPALAHRALNAQPEVGLFMPCNVTVETTPEGKSLVRIIDARQMMGVGELGENAALREVAMEAYGRLNLVAERIRSA